MCARALSDKYAMNFLAHVRSRALSQRNGAEIRAIDAHSMLYMLREDDV